MIERLPDDVTPDDILREIYFKVQVDAGLEEIDEGLDIPHEAVEGRLSE